MALSKKDRCFLKIQEMEYFIKNTSNIQILYCKNLLMWFFPGTVARKNVPCNSEAHYCPWHF